MNKLLELEAEAKHLPQRRHVASTTATLIASQLLIAIAGVIASRELGPSGRGVVTGVLAWGQAIPLFAVAGLNSALLVRVAEAPITDVREALGNALAYAFGIGGTIALAAALIVPGVVAHLGGAARPLAVVVMIAIPFALLNELLFAVNVATGRIRFYNVCRLASPVAVFVGTVALLLTGQITTTSIVLLTTGSGVATTFVAAVGLPWRDLATSRRTFIADARFGFKVAIAGWLGYANLRFDVLAMSAFISAPQVGYYGVANNAMLPVTSIAASASGLLTPAVARLGTVTSDLAARQIALIRSELLRYGVMAAVGGVLLAAVSPFAIPLLFGDAFRPSITLIWILIPGYVARACAGIVIAGAVGMRRPAVGNAVEVLSLGVTAALLPLLLSRYEARGAAIASTAAYVTGGVVALIMLRRMVRGATRPAPTSDGETGR
jgi:stage V sporulation protein B